MAVSERINHIGESPTMKVAAKAIEMKSKGLAVYDLSVGEPDFPTPRNIKDAAINAINQDFTKYTLNAGTVELRKAIAQKLKEENGLEYAIEDIIASNGAKQSIFNAMQSLVYVNDEVIIPSPYWVSYPHMVTLAHGDAKIVDTTEENNFKLTAKQLKEAITDKTKVLILCNPSNPTGSVYNRQELEAIAEVLEDTNIYVIADEIYEKLVYDDFNFASFASISEKMKERTVVVNGFSKSYAMTGWRLGYAAGPSHIIKGMHKVQSHSTSGPNSISQQAAIEALTGPQETLEEMLKEFQKRRNYLIDALRDIEGISCVKPDGAFYLFPNISHYMGKSTDVFKVENSFDLAMHLLYKAKTAVVPGSSFGAEGYMRFSYANSMESLEKAVENIKKALNLLN
jgi:aspartate/methionine/tyrosine aminotransferase